MKKRARFLAFPPRSYACIKLLRLALANGLLLPCMTKCLLTPFPSPPPGTFRNSFLLLLFFLVHLLFSPVNTFLGSLTPFCTMALGGEETKWKKKSVFSLVSSAVVAAVRKERD